MKTRKLYGACVCLLGSLQLMAQTETMDLSGLWRFQLDPMGFGKTPGSELYLKQLTESVQLPGTMDESGKGIKNVVNHIDRLSRKFEYNGQAWYQREIIIPEDWKDKEILLSLERCHWETAVYMDGKHIATDERLSTPNRFLLPSSLTPGSHTLTICVDNRLKYPMDQWNHGTTEYTQTNWNGIVGQIELISRSKTHIQQVKITPVVDEQKVNAHLQLVRSSTQKATDGEVQIRIFESDGALLKESSFPISFTQDTITLQQDLILGKSMKLWDEFHPNLYRMEIRLKAGSSEDHQTETFGMRKVEQGKHHIRLNNRDIHLRGVLDCAVFPLTGYPSTQVTEWQRIFRTVKEYGMNHVRFHSWCPPRAAFQAADSLGMYLQVELPMWIKDVGQYPARRDFFEKEMYAILNEYGNHPSFILMCNGNENEGNFDVLEDLVRKAQTYDNRRLYSASTARTHVKADQYYTSHVTHKGYITVYEGKPSTDWDRRVESDIDVPVIAHETGQRCMYPNFNEIKKYTGVLEARNFKYYQESLSQNGMLHQADDFFKATGAHTVLQYKEVNEALLRTPNSGGFQLLGLSDFPGQGSAFVGILDAFWETKGLVSPEKYRESCAPTVLLARLPKRTYLNNETFTACLEIYHYGEKPIKSQKLTWQVQSEQGEVIRKGTISLPAIPCATVDSLGKISVDLASIQSAGKYTLKASLNGITQNEWDIWVYPNHSEEKENPFILAHTWDENTRQQLLEGANILLIPQEVKGRKARFTSHFWNPIMFRWDPMIVGTRIESNHPVFKDFPTSYYADWQWWDILNYATALELDGLKEITPVIQCIDSYETNHKLGIAFEAQAGKGKLFVLAVDPTKDLNKREAMQQLLRSVRNYVSSSSFQPSVTVPLYKLDALFDHTPVQQKQQATDAATKQLQNR